MSNQSNTEKEASTSVKKNQHILIIDDDVEVTESIRQALLAVGYSVSVALDGNQGLAYTEAKSPGTKELGIGNMQRCWVSMITSTNRLRWIAY